MKILLSFIFASLTTTISFSQTTLYVAADNGLYVREAPGQAAKVITKLSYGTKVHVTAHTNLTMDVLEKGQIINGEWVKVNAYANYNYIEGYAFNGYLSEEELQPRVHINFDEFKVTFEDLHIISTQAVKDILLKDSIAYDIELGYSPEDKLITIKPTVNYKKIEVFQSYQTSISIMNEGPHCDLLDGQHYSSDWEVLRPISNNTYRSCSYSETDWRAFDPIDLNELKAQVLEHCGPTYAMLIDTIKSVNEGPVAVSISTIYFKIVITESNNDKIEKIIALNIPIGC